MIPTPVRIGRGDISDPDRYGRDPVDLAEMGDTVKDAILTNEFHDYPLYRLVDLTITAITEDRPMFPTVFGEPAFYRTFRQWVQEALDEKEREMKAQSGGLETLGYRKKNGASE